MVPNDRLKIFDVGNRELLRAAKMKLEERKGAICNRQPGGGEKSRLQAEFFSRAWGWHL